MAPLAAQLAPHFTVFTYDRRGRGDSGDKAPYAVEREVEDIDALIKVAGGWLSCAGFPPARRRPSRPRTAGWSSGSWPSTRRRSSSTTLATRSRGHRAAAPAPGRRGSAERRGQAFYENRRCPGSVHRPDAIHASVVEAQGCGAHASVRPTIVWDNQRGRPLPLTRWTAATVPTLVVAGGKSPVWMRNGMQALARSCRARHRTLEGQTHMVNAKALAPVLAEFFGS